MRKRTIFNLIIERRLHVAIVMIIAAVTVCGCSSRSLSVAEDQSKARNLLDQVYAGSLGAVQDDLAVPIQRGMSDKLTAKVAATLLSNYGMYRNLTLVSAEKGPMRFATAEWEVEAERSNYQMRITIDGKGKVTGLWFRSAAEQEWIPSPILGQPEAIQKRYLEDLKGQ